MQHFSNKVSKGNMRTEMLTCNSSHWARDNLPLGCFGEWWTEESRQRHPMQLLCHLLSPHGWPVNSHFLESSYKCEPIRFYQKFMWLEWNVGITIESVATNHPSIIKKCTSPVTLSEHCYIKCICISALPGFIFGTTLEVRHYLIC